MATILLLIIYLVFISLGLPDSLLGAAWPAAYLELGVPVSSAGFTSVFITLGTVCSSLLAVTLVRRFGPGRVTACCVLLTACALLSMSFCRTYPVLCLLSLPLGLGGGSIDAVLNNYVANHYRAVQMNLLHAFWGIGATCGPLIMSAFLRQGGNWHGGYRTVACIQLGIAAVAFAALPVWRRVKRQTPEEADPAHTQALGNRAALRVPGVPLGMLAFFFYCAMEMSTGLWAATYYAQAKGVSAEIAAGYGSLFFAGIMTGRIVSGFASIRLSERTLITTGMITAFLGACGMALLPMPYGVAGLLLVGLGCAPIFPNLLQLTPVHFGQAASQAAMGLQMAASYVGSTLMPPLFGIIGERFGFALLPGFLLLCLAALALVAMRLRRCRAGMQPDA